MEIDIRSVSLRLKNNQVLDNFSYKMVSGNRYGLLGHNGSGKTMLLRAICGFVRLDSGSVVVDGKVVGSKGYEFVKNAGVVVGEVDFYKNLSGIDNLRLLANIRKMADEDRLHEVLTQVGLAEHEDVKYKKYSTGMKARLRIAQAIMENPSLLILDEPFNGLDKAGVAAITGLINDYLQEEHILIITSHHESDIENMCNVTLELDGGRLVDESA